MVTLTQPWPRTDIMAWSHSHNPLLTNILTHVSYPTAQEVEVTLPQKGNKKGSTRGCPKKAKLASSTVTQAIPTSTAQSAVTSQTVLPPLGTVMHPGSTMAASPSPLLSTQSMATNATPVTVLPGSVVSTVNKVRLVYHSNSNEHSQLIPLHCTHTTYAMLFQWKVQ